MQDPEEQKVSKMLADLFSIVGKFGVDLYLGTVTSLTATQASVILDSMDSGEIGPLPVIRGLPSIGDRVILFRLSPAENDFIILGVEHVAAGDLTIIFDSGGFFGLGGTSGLYYMKRTGGVWDVTDTLLSSGGGHPSIAQDAQNEANDLSEPTNIYARNAGLWGKPYGPHRVFRLSDGKVIVFLFDQSLLADAGDGWSREAYMIRSAGTWGALTNLSNTEHSTGEYWLCLARDGDNFYGMCHNNDTGKVQTVKVVYSGGVITTTFGPDISNGGNDEPFWAYWDGDNGIFHVVFTDNVGSGNVWLAAIDPSSLAVLYSYNLIASNAPIYTSDNSMVRIVGDGTSTFMVFSNKDGVTSLTGWKVVASASSYTVTDESSSIPAFPSSGTISNVPTASMSGTDVVLVASLLPSVGAPGLYQLTRSSTGVYTGWDLIIASTTGFRFIQNYLVSCASGVNARALYISFTPSAHVEENLIA